jgi:GTP1/Obg family GTP-binding protein
MSTRLASRLTRIERNERSLVVVEDQKALEAARAFLQGRPDVDMDRITFVITGVPRNGRGPEDWLRAARGEAPVSRHGE